MDAEGVRGICGRCDFKGDTFRTRKALQVSVGQHDCGRFPAQKGTFRKRVGDLPQIRAGDVRGRKTTAIPAGGLASGVLAEELPGVEEVVPDSVEAAGHGGDGGEIVDAEPDDEAGVFLAKGLAGGN